MQLSKIYGKNADSNLERIASLLKTHEKLFNCPAEHVFSTAGRTELGGNHTDHNLGKVLAGSVHLDTLAAVHETNDYTVTILSEGFEPVSVDISFLSPKEEEKGKTDSLVRGIAASFVTRGAVVGGFCANTNTKVLKGSGLSSSAAIEVLIGTIFNSLFNGNKFSPLELAIMGQEAENVYFGKPCGLMDQIACANGGIVAIDFAQKDLPVVTPVDCDFSDYGYSLIVVNTGGNHANLTQDYAAIPAEMKAVAAYFNENVLRAVSYENFLNELPALRQKLGNDRAVLRAIHYFNENLRVDKMLKALQDKDFPEYLGLVRQSGDSSYKFLQNIYSPSLFSEQGISLGLALTENFLSSQGACRVQGGGFAGTIQAYVPFEQKARYIKYMEKVFGQGSCLEIEIRQAPTCEVFL